MEFEHNGTTVYYKIEGEGMPVLMIHGYTPDHRLMSGCMEPVFASKPGYRRIYFDLPGMGRSKASEEIRNTDDMLDIVACFIDAVLPRGTFLIAAESYGCYLARALVMKIPQRIDGMLLICPMIVAERERRVLPKHTVIQKDSALAARFAAEENGNLDEMLVIQNSRTYARNITEIMTGLRLTDTDFTECLRVNGYPFSFDVDGQSSIYEKPSLILLGRQDSVVGYADALKLLEKYPRATYAVLDAAGHNLQIEQETLFNALVNEWLDRVEFARANP